MTEAANNPRPIVLLAPDGDIRQRLRRLVPGIKRRTQPLEALAEMATANPRAVVVTASAMGYRRREILGAIRSAVGSAPVYLACHPAQETEARACDSIDDYFIVPYALRDLAARLQNGGDKTHSSASVAASGSDRERLDACLKTVTDTAGALPAEIAKRAVEGLAAMGGIVSAALLADKGAVPLASSDSRADWSAAGACWSDGRAAKNQWTATGSGTQLFVGRGGGQSEIALALRFSDESPDPRLIEDVTVIARTALALVAAARVREAAMRVLATDPETALASRRYFGEYLAAMLRRAGERRREVTLAVMAPVSNSSVGRTTLRALADLLKQTFPSARAGRVNAETLGVCLAGAGGHASAVEALQKFADRVHSAALPAPVAMGSATFPWHGSDARALLDAAADRLARSRDAGTAVFD
jgi:GGDEF domain-containing protein